MRRREEIGELKTFYHKSIYLKVKKLSATPAKSRQIQRYLLLEITIILALNSTPLRHKKTSTQNNAEVFKFFIAFAIYVREVGSMQVMPFVLLDWLSHRRHHNPIQK